MISFVTFKLMALLIGSFVVSRSLAFTTLSRSSRSLRPSFAISTTTTSSSSSTTTRQRTAIHGNSQSSLFASHHHPTTENNHEENNNTGRRQVFVNIALVASSSLLMLLPKTAVAGSLLEDYGGSDPTKIVQPVKPEEEYVGTKKGENAIDPTLRASYYFPTARKRYLPRIQKVSNQLKQVIPTAFSSNTWLDEMQSLYATADNAILPMKLYTSSLDGQGLRMTQSEFVKTMKSSIDKYERQVQVLSKALAKQDKIMAQTAVQQLSDALMEFRAAGRLTEDIEDLPSVDEIRRMTMRRPTMKFTQY